MGDIFYIANGEHPIQVNGKAIEAPRFIGYKKMGNRYLFKFKTKLGQEVQTEIKATKNANILEEHVELIGEGRLDYASSKTKGVTVKRISDKQLVVTIKHDTVKRYAVVKEKPLTAKDVSAINGEKIFNRMACITCHSVDGSDSHGPTLKAVAGSPRHIIGIKEPIMADDTYLKESILTPNKKVVKGFQPNYMPPFNLKENELKSLVLYIKTLKNE